MSTTTIATTAPPTPDPWLLPLCRAASDCYGPTPASWTNDETHVYQSVVRDVVCFAFEGTSDWQEWVRDFDIVQWPVANHPQLGDVHEGFMADVQFALDDYILPKMVSLGWPPFVITGHSKGAAEAILCHALLKAMAHPALATRAYEPPRCGTDTLRQWVRGDDIAWTRTGNVDGPDVVCTIPDGFSWRHIDNRVSLRVPDSCDVATKHEIPAVLAAVTALVGA